MGRTKTETEKGAGSHKMALLRIMEFFLEQTDEDHPANAADISAYLEKWEISEDRRTIYTDVALLADFGLDIEKAQSGRGGGGWYLASRRYELAELKLLADAVQASKVITEKKTRELIAKLEKETSQAHAEELHREVFVRRDRKSGNETIFYNIDAIHEAIRRNCQIQFRYGFINVKKHLVMRKDGAIYQLSPWALAWQEENYYLIAYDAEEEKIKHFRVDKMMRTKVVADEERLGGDRFQQFDLGDYLGKTFSMFSGKDEEVQFRCRDYMAGVMVERFGQDRMLVPEEGGTGYFHMTATVSVSSQFYGWLAGLDGGVEILAPERVRTEYRDYLKKLLAAYEES